jgi:D-proline reductase (dithiol) PrdB
VCHQTVGLVARHLEANGVPTVIFGCARDIVEYCGVPRFLFSDFPLGNPCGKPFDPAMQRAIVLAGLELLAGATRPGTTVVTPFEWGSDATWKEKVFTPQQPFLDESATERWLRGKEAYRARKSGSAEQH